jgi:aspartate-semialdehyde dehydrogenase/adenine nucleotide transporter 17
LQIVHADGIGGLFKGLGAQLLKTVLAAALMLAIKEKAYKAALSLMLAFRGGPPGLPAPAAKPRI